MAKGKALNAAMTKSQMFSEIAENTELSKRAVTSVFDALETVIGRHVKKGSVGYCTVPGLMKNQDRPEAGPTSQAECSRTRFGPGEFMDVQAKPASTRVKILALKKLKNMV